VSAGPLFFIVIGDGRGSKMPALTRFAGQADCYFIVDYNGARTRGGSGAAATFPVRAGVDRAV
jgi:hypothetical protein